MPWSVRAGSAPVSAARRLPTLLATVRLTETESKWMARPKVSRSHGDTSCSPHSSARSTSDGRRSIRLDTCDTSIGTISIISSAKSSEASSSTSRAPMSRRTPRAASRSTSGTVR